MRLYVCWMLMCTVYSCYSLAVVLDFILDFVCNFAVLPCKATRIERDFPSVPSIYIWKEIWYIFFFRFSFSFLLCECIFYTVVVVVVSITNTFTVFCINYGGFSLVSDMTDVFLAFYFSCKLQLILLIRFFSSQMKNFRLILWKFDFICIFNTIFERFEQTHWMLFKKFTEWYKFE